MNPSGTATRRVRWRRLLIDPARLWVRHAPTPWPGPAAHWTDLARLAPGRGDELDDSSIDDAGRSQGFDDTVWLPPVAPSFAGARERLLKRLRDAGVPVVDQRMPGDDAPQNGAAVVYDLFEALLAHDAAVLGRLPRGSWALWPLIPGVTDEPEQVERGLAALRDAGVAGVHGVTLELDSRQRRELAEMRGDDAFDALFHGVRPSERNFARRAQRVGLAVFFRRPLPTAPRLAGNRRLAEVLFSAGDLWRRLDRRPVQRENLLAAARRLDDADHDMQRLIGEGNLDIVDWLPPQAKALLAESVATGESTLLGELRRQYLEDET